MSDLVEFLLARIDEDEAVAREAVDSERPGTHWHWVLDADDTTPVVDGEGTLTDATGEQWAVSLRSVEEFPTTSGVGDLPAIPFSADEVPAGVATHIARHDPARVLAECEAKRRIVEEHRPIPCENARHPNGLHCVVCSYEDIPKEWHPCVTVRLLALPYADHPDYDPAWNPEATQ